MKAEATDIKDGTLPAVKIELFRDRNGNWFASVEERRGIGISVRCTATYTTPIEACADALREIEGDANA